MFVGSAFAGRTQSNRPDSISLDPDSFAATVRHVAEVEPPAPALGDDRGQRFDLTGRALASNCAGRRQRKTTGARSTAVRKLPYGEERALHDTRQRKFADQTAIKAGSLVTA